MMPRNEKEKIQSLLKDTITLLCRNGLTFKNQFSVEAVVGITLDEDTEFHFIINEKILSSPLQQPEYVADDKSEGVYEDEDSASGADHPGDASPAVSVIPVARERNVAKRCRKRVASEMHPESLAYGSRAATVDTSPSGDYAPVATTWHQQSRAQLGSLSDAGNVKVKREVIDVKDDEKVDQDLDMLPNLSEAYSADIMDSRVNFGAATSVGDISDVSIPYSSSQQLANSSYSNPGHSPRVFPGGPVGWDNYGGRSSSQVIKTSNSNGPRSLRDKLYDVVKSILGGKTIPCKERDLLAREAYVKISKYRLKLQAVTDPVLQETSEQIVFCHSSGSVKTVPKQSSVQTLVERYQRALSDRSVTSISEQLEERYTGISNAAIIQFLRF